MPEIDPNANIAQYKFSNQQNLMVQAHQARIARAAAEVEDAQKEAEQARLMYEARNKTLDARKSAHQSETENRDGFLNYIINEFNLPAPKAGRAWIPREFEPGKFALFAEVDESVPATPPATAKEARAPKHEWRRKKRTPAPVTELPKADTNNNTAEPPAA